MTRVTSTILVIMILLNGSITVYEGSGLSDDVGVVVAPGVNAAMNDVVDYMKKGFNPNTNIAESVINLMLAGLSVFRVVVEGLHAAPSMFINLGFPDWVVYPFMAPLYLISTLEMVYVVTGRNMV